MTRITSAFPVHQRIIALVEAIISWRSHINLLAQSIDLGAKNETSDARARSPDAISEDQIMLRSILYKLLSDFVVVASVSQRRLSIRGDDLQLHARVRVHSRLF